MNVAWHQLLRRERHGSMQTIRSLFQIIRRSTGGEEGEREREGRGGVSRRDSKEGVKGERGRERCRRKIGQGSVEEGIEEERE